MERVIHPEHLVPFFLSLRSPAPAPEILTGRYRSALLRVTSGPAFLFLGVLFAATLPFFLPGMRGIASCQEAGCQSGDGQHGARHLVTEDPAGSVRSTENTSCPAYPKSARHLAARLVLLGVLEVSVVPGNASLILPGFQVGATSLSLLRRQCQLAPFTMQRLHVRLQI